jgi:hypothetical protein
MRTIVGFTGDKFSAPDVIAARRKQVFGVDVLA